MNFDRESTKPSVDLVMHTVLGFTFVLCSGAGGMAGRRRDLPVAARTSTPEQDRQTQRPPSTSRQTPVMKRASSEAR